MEPEGGTREELGMIESAERAATASSGYGLMRPNPAWAGSIMAGIAITLGGVALLLGPNWTLMWVAVVLLVLALTTGSVLRRLGFGHS